jgi:hypothetical protein
MIEFESITRTDQTVTTGAIKARVLDSLMALAVTLVTLAAAWGMLAATDKPATQAEPLRIHTDCSGFVEGAE